jgi:hypothetical protein
VTDLIVQIGGVAGALLGFAGAVLALAGAVLVAALASGLVAVVGACAVVMVRAALTHPATPRRRPPAATRSCRKHQRSTQALRRSVSHTDGRSSR